MYTLEEGDAAIEAKEDEIDTTNPTYDPDSWHDDFPELFEWSCCQRRGDDPSEGCVKGRHSVVKRKGMS